MEKKLSAIRVKLLEWSYLDNNTLRLYFEKVPTFLYQRRFREKTDSVYTDFGFLEIILKGDYEKARTFNTLDNYINDDEVFIEEGDNNTIDFWNGQYVDKYDWVSDYYTTFTEKTVNEIPLDEEQWKAKYTQMTLDYAEIRFEQWDKLELKFFNLYAAVTEGIVSRWAQSETSDHNKRWLLQNLNDIRKNIEKRTHEEEEIKNTQSVDLNEKNFNETQQKVNSSIFAFWENLKKIWR